MDDLMTGASGRRTARTVEFTPAWSSPQRRSLEASALGRLAYSTGRAVGRWIVAPPVRVRVTRLPAHQEDGSSWIARGDVACRSWSLTASCSLDSHARRLVMSALIWQPARSASGPAGIRTSGSSRSSNEVADTIGTAGVTPAENGETE